MPSKFSVVIGLFLAVLSAVPIQAQQSTNGCAVDSIGMVYCAPPGGGAAVDSIGSVQCGPGSCVVNSIGAVYCSSSPGGGAATDSIGSVKCTDGCVRGSKQYCKRGES